MTEKLTDWQPRLMSYLRSVKSRPFDEQGHNCLTFVNDARSAMTGLGDIHPDVRGYSNFEEGYELLRDSGFRGLDDLMASVLDEVPVSLAQPGDIVFLNHGNTQGLGIVQGRYAWVVSLTGIGLTYTNKATRAFRT